MALLAVRRLMAFGLLVVVIIVIVVVVTMRGNDSPSGADDGGGSLRGTFVHALSLLGAALTASGLAGLLRVLVESLVGTELVGGSARGLAFGLSLTIVGLPLWALTWRAAQRSAATAEDERRSLARRVYLAVLRAASLAVAVPAAIETGQGLAGVDLLDTGAIARFLVWTAVWAYHERVASVEVPFGTEGTGRVDRLEVFLVAASSLGLFGGAVGSLLERALTVLYELATGTTTLVATTAIADPLVSPAIAAVVGGAVWWWHWGVIASRDVGSRPWHTYVFLVGILGGTAAAIVSGSVVLHRLLAWAVGAASEPAVEHFDVVPAALAGLTVGIVVWGHHRAVLHEAPRQRRGGPAERVYRYLLTAAGMATASAGTATVLMVGIDLVVPGRTLVTAPGGVRDAVAVGVTLLLIGIPLWLRSWGWAEGRVREDPAERSTLPRRVLIFGAFGVATVATVTASSILLYELFDALFAGEFDVRLIAEQRWAIAVLLTAGAVSVHYGLVLREDRGSAPAETSGAALREIVVVAGGAAALGGALRQRTDVRVTAWERAGAPRVTTSDDLVERIVGHLEGVDVRRALVLVDEDGTVEVIPFDTP